MKVHIFEGPNGGQLSPEWWEARRGKPSSSEFNRIMTPAQRKLSEGSEKYINELIADRICQLPNYFTALGRPVSKAMQDGIDNEPDGRRWYEQEASVDVLQVGGCETDDGRFWCSPDGLVGEDGGLELKCPQLDTHVAYCRNPDLLLDEYKCQVHGALIITGRKWWDLVSYNTGVPPMPGVVIRVVPDDFTRDLHVRLEQFWARYVAAWTKIGGL